MDNGCDVTLVHSDFVKPINYIGQTIACRLADKSEFVIPLADVEIQCSLYEGILRVGVSDSLTEDVLLAVEATPTRVRYLTDDGHTNVIGVATRSQVKSRMMADKADDEAHQKVKLSKLEPPELSVSEVFSSGDMRTQVESGTTQSAPGKPDVDATSIVVDPETFVEHVVPERNSIVSSKPDAVVSSGAEFDPVDADVASSCGSVVGFEKTRVDNIDIDCITPDILKHMQSIDASLKKVRSLTVHPDKVKSKGVVFYRRDGIYYRKWTPRDPQKKDFGVVQVVVPKQWPMIYLSLVTWASRKQKTGLCRTFTGPEFSVMLQNIVEAVPSVKRLPDAGKGKLPSWARCRSWMNPSNELPWISLASSIVQQEGTHMC